MKGWRLMIGKGKKQQDLTEELKELNPELCRQIDKEVSFMMGIEVGERVYCEEETEALPYD